jgi:hypothetical protein
MMAVPKKEFQHVAAKAHRGLPGSGRSLTPGFLGSGWRRAVPGRHRIGSTVLCVALVADSQPLRWPQQSDHWGHEGSKGRRQAAFWRAAERLAKREALRPPEGWPDPRSACSLTEHPTAQVHVVDDWLLGGGR